MSNKAQTAVVFGSTGLVGSFVLSLLQNDDRYSKIFVFNRSKRLINSPKTEQIRTDFSNLPAQLEGISANHIFCCVGTTIKKAGSQKEFEKIDYQIPVEVAKAIKSKTSKLILVSSLGADKNSSGFYLRIKGRMEESVKELIGERFYAVRPSFLLGDRTEKRPAEWLMKHVFNALSFLFIGPLKKYKAIPANQVAKAMIEIVNSGTLKSVYESDELWNF